MSKVTAYYHIVFCTKHRGMTITEQYSDDVYRFIWHIIKEFRCELLRIGGIDNHIHILLNLHPSIALSTLIQHIKGRTSTWMKTDNRFPQFGGWAAEYYACTISPEQKYVVVEYIKSQRTHHLGTPIDDELKDMYAYASLKYDDRDLQ